MSLLNSEHQESVSIQTSVFFTGLILNLCIAAVIFTNSGGVVSDRIAKLNPNTACAGELAELPSMGDKKAQAIVDYRAADSSQKAFSNADDLKKVKGIGKKTVEKIRPWIEFNTD